MSFWNTSDGTDLTENASKEYDGGGSFDLIPDKTGCLAVVHTAKWDEDRDGNRFINIRWKILKHEEYENRAIFQKLYVDEDSPNPNWGDKDKVKERDKALLKFSTIDACAGGLLARKGRVPTDDAMAVALTNKPMMIFVGLYDFLGRDGSQVTGNSVNSIGPKDGNIKVTAPGSEPKKAARKPETKKPFDDDLDDDVPF